MRLRHWSAGSLGAVWIVTLGATAGIAADRPSIVVKLPAIGRAAGATVPLQRALEGVGLTANVLPTLTAVGSVKPPPAAAIVYQTEVLDEADARAIQDAVKQGMGLVYLVSATPERFDAANGFLRDVGLSVAEAPREGRGVRIVAPDIAPGVSESPCPRLGVAISGRDALVIGTQQGRSVIVGAAYGKGRVVVMPVDVLAGERSSEPPAAEVLSVVVECAAWAGHLQAAGTPVVAAQQPQGVKPLPQSSGRKPAIPVPEASLQAFPPSEDFRGRTLVDVGVADDNWPAILQALRPVLQSLEAAPAALKTGAVKDPLVEALRSEPALAVIGSGREFSDAESVALANYIRLGGRALLLARATDGTVMRIVALNNLMFSLDVTAALGRPGGPVELQEHPAVQGITRLGNLPPGVRFMSEMADPVAIAGGCPFAVAGQPRAGRFLAIDATPLAIWVGKDPKVAAARDIYVDIVRSCVGWLTAK